MPIFQTQFFLNAFLAGTLIGIIAPMIGLFLVVRRYAPLADTLSHVSLVGVAAGLLSGLPPMIASTITALVAAFGIEKLRQSKQIFGESILVIFLSGSLGIASILLSFIENSNSNLNSYLFGNLNTVTQNDLFYLSFITISTLFFTIIGYRRLFLICLDEELAKLSGVRVTLWNNLLIGFAALVISSSIGSIGVLLISSLVVIPAISALQLKLSFRSSLILSICFSVTSVWAGLFLSFSLDLPTSGSIVVCNLIIFIFSLIWRA